MSLLLTIALLVLLGVAVGAFGTLVGAGGGFVLTPVLLLLYGSDSAETISAISLAVVFFNAASGTAAYARLGRIDYRSGVLFALATLPGSIAGALLTSVTSRRLFDAVTGAVLGGLGLWLLVGRRAAGAAQRRSGSPREIRGRDGTVFRYRAAVLPGIALSVVVGLLSSFLGIGGGVIHVPLLVQALGFPVHVATATSHFVITIMAGVGTLTHVAAGSFVSGQVVGRTAALSAGAIIGAQLGARLSQRIGDSLIRRLLSVALLLLAGRVLAAVVWPF